MKEQGKAVVIFSGGQDSTTCLYWAINRYTEVECITFNYGQKHSVELDCAKRLCDYENIKQTVIDISFLDTIVESALTSNGRTAE
jgi:7-cyano-7-deazaguanine synthase